MIKTIRRKRQDKHSNINEQNNNTPNSKRFNSSTDENVLDDNIVIEFLATHRDYIEKFQVIELSQELITTQTHLTD
ncbi:unnamed protein product, partial [Rotaria sordida]